MGLLQLSLWVASLSVWIERHEFGIAAGARMSLRGRWAVAYLTLGPLCIRLATL